MSINGALISIVYFMNESFLIAYTVRTDNVDSLKIDSDLLYIQVALNLRNYAENIC